MIRTLIVDDCREDREDIAAFLGKRFKCDHAANGDEAFKLLQESSYQLILLDIEFNDDRDGFQILARMTRECPHIPVVMVTQYYDTDRIMKAVRLGAVHYVGKKEMPTMLPIAIEKALNEAALRNARLASFAWTRTEADSFLGQSDAAKKIRAEAIKLAQSEKPLLITGETGTGKDLLARIIHNLSPRRSHSFVKAIIPELNPNIIERELFGHLRGSFTGAEEHGIGCIEAANRGTLFLNEIGDVDLSNQVKLLRVLDDGTFVRIGSPSENHVDARFIAATNRDIEKLVAEKAFREDLYYRISTFRIHIPPLRERREDIPHLIHHFLKLSAAENEMPLPYMSADIIEYLCDYDWPGNARELQSTIERAIFSMEDNVIRFQDVVIRPIKSYGHMSYAEAFENFQKLYIMDILERNDRNVAKAAKQAHITEKSVYRIMKKFGMKTKRDGGEPSS